MASDRFSPLSTPSATREVLERHGLFTKYALGQNFLVNDDVIRRILELADVRSSDRILEVGPGIGTLTAALLQRVEHVTAIEKDPDLLPVLADTLAEWQDRFTLVQADALQVETTCRPGPAQLGTTRQAGDAQLGGTCQVDLVGTPSRASAQAGQTDALEGAPTKGSQSGERSSIELCPNKLVSNLPYSIAATVTLDYLQRFSNLESATVMVQKEVADRMTAKPGTKTYGAYTVKLSLYARPAGRFPVAPGNFFPPPHVESAVLRLDRAVARDETGDELSPEILAAICEMADAAFATRRKTLANSCKTYFANDPETQARLSEIFGRAGVDSRRRGETLTRDEFVKLGAALADMR